MHDEELTPNELEAFRSLPRESRPSDLLEERTVRTLAEHGWLRHRRSVPAPLAWSTAAAACILFFVAGFAIGQKRGDVNARPSSPLAPALSTRADSSGQPIQDSTDVTLADPTAKPSSGVQRVVWF